MLLPLFNNLSRFEICLNHMFGQELPPVNSFLYNSNLMVHL